MAFDPANIRRMATFNGRTWWDYLTTSESFVSVETAGYFNNFAKQLDLYDKILVFATDAIILYTVTAVTKPVNIQGVVASPAAASVTISKRTVLTSNSIFGAALSVVGNATNVSAADSDITAVAASGAVLRESGSTLGFGTVATAGLTNNAVTFAKMQQIATDSLLGRDTASTGDVENITLNTTLSMTGAGALQRAALTGDVTASAGSNTTTIATTDTSWTPVLTFATPGDVNVVYATQVGRYIKLGDMYLLLFNIQTSTFTFTTAAGNLQITGSPATASTVNATGWMPWFQGVNVAGGYSVTAPHMGATTNVIEFITSGMGLTSVFMSTAAGPATGTNVTFRGGLVFFA